MKMSLSLEKQDIVDLEQLEGGQANLTKFLPNDLNHYFKLYVCWVGLLQIHTSLYHWAIGKQTLVFLKKEDIVLVQTALQLTASYNIKEYSAIWHQIGYYAWSTG